MKILHIIDGLFMGGAENLLIGLAGEQVANGEEVLVVPLVCPKHTPVREKMELKGVSVQPIETGGSVYNPLLIFRLFRIMRGYDVIHVHLFPALYWAGFAKLLSFNKTPLVYTEHSTNNKRRENKFLHFTDRIIYQYCYKMVVACSEKALVTYQQAYPSVKHTYVINNGVNTKIFKDAKPYTKEELLGIDESSFIVTMVARFMTMKRQDTIVEAIAKLPNNIHAVLVGGEETDEGLQRVKQLAKAIGVQDRVHFLYIRKDVPRILKTSDAVIMASDYEGLSLSSIEGMAAGKPFIATNVNGLKEVVGGAGLLFENKDSEELAGLINKLATDKDYYFKIASNCAERAIDYDIKGMVDTYAHVYNEVIKN